MAQMLVYFCKVARKPQRTLFQRDFDTDIKAVINPREQVDRYSRTWRFSQPKVRNRHLVGKLGFTAPGTETKAEYNEETNDFVEPTVDARQATFVFWVIDLSNQVLAFEAKPPQIQYQSFRGAFEKFLAGHPEMGFQIEDFLQTAQFLAWVKNEVDRVVSFKATLCPESRFLQASQVHPEALGGYQRGQGKAGVS